MIAGLCRIWARPKSGDNHYWTKLTYAPRGYHECEQLVDIYEEEWGTHYSYEITADSDICRPVC